MTEKLQEILNNYSEDIERYNKERNRLIVLITFYETHNFSEEARVERIKYEIFDMLVIRWESMRDDIQELLNNWEL